MVFGEYIDTLEATRRLSLPEGALRTTMCGE